MVHVFGATSTTEDTLSGIICAASGFWLPVFRLDWV